MTVLKDTLLDHKGSSSATQIGSVAVVEVIPTAVPLYHMKPLKNTLM